MAQQLLEDNPVTLELKILRESVTRFQDEAHESAVKLQRHSLDSVKIHERAVNLERENDLLKAEIAVLRANPHPDSETNSPDTRLQVQELTLALRRLSQKLSSTEDALLSKTTELIHAQAEMVKAKAAAEGAYELGARVRGREEAALARELELQGKVAQLEEECRIADIALKEYAALVREMDRNRRSGDVTKQSVDEHEMNESTRISATAHEEKLTHSKSLEQFQVETVKLGKEIHRITSELEVTTSLLEAEKKGTAALVQEISNSKHALENQHLEDATAAKMVSRYMQFSQTSTNDLLSKLSALKARHAGTLSTLTSQNHALTVQLRSSEAHAEHLLRTLDELGGEIMKEMWGRRREVGLRIRMGGREERVTEGLRRWVRRGEELLTRVSGLNSVEENPDAQPNPSLEALHLLTQDARILLASLDEGVFDEGLGLSLSGGKARVLLADLSLDGLLDELKNETERRLGLEKQLMSIKVGRTRHYGVALPMKTKQNENENYEPNTLMDSGLSKILQDDTAPMVPEKSPNQVPISTPSQVNLPQSVNGYPTSDIIEPPSEPSAVLTTSNAPIESTSSTEQVPLQTMTEEITFPSVETTESTDSIPTPEPTLESIIDIGVSTIDLLPSFEVEDETTVTEDLAGSNTSTVSIQMPDAPEVQEESIVTKDIPDNIMPTISVVLLDTPQSPLLAITVEEASVPAPQSIPGFSVGSIEIPTSSEYIDAETQSPTIRTTTLDEDSPPLSPLTTESAVLAENRTSAESSEITLVFADPSPPTLLPTPIEELVTISDSPFASSIRPIVTEKSALPHPLLSELVRITKRYDDLQRAFRDCQHALESLKPGLKGTSGAIPKDILNAALGRLDDYTEDARVELEIRIGDEALLAKGYEALLSVPGALGSATLSAPDSNLSEGDRDVPTQSEVERQVSEFVEGTDPAVRRARETFSRKLDDVQHDIAALKRAIHDPESFSGLQSYSTDSLASSSSLSGSPLVSPSTSRTELSNAEAQPSGRWTSWIRNVSRPANPAPPPHPAPTFGNIMTAPRLRHVSSFGGMNTTTAPPSPSPARSRRPSFFSLDGSSEPSASPLAALDLRVPMPNFGTSASNNQPLSASIFGGAYSGIMSPTSPLKSATMAPPTRVRTVSSTMYMLGLGATGPGSGGRMARAASAGVNIPVPASPLRGKMEIPLQTPSVKSAVNVSTTAARASHETEDEETETEEEEDTDVE